MKNITYKRFVSRLDSRNTCFDAGSPEANTELKRIICSNGHTGYVVQKNEGGPITVPTFKADAVESHIKAA